MRLDVRFGVEIPDGVTAEEARAWMEFVLGVRGDLSLRNPFAGRTLSVVPDSLAMEPPSQGGGKLLDLLERLERTAIQRRTEAATMAAEMDDSWRLLAQEVASIRHGVLDSE